MTYYESPYPRLTGMCEATLEGIVRELSDRPDKRSIKRALTLAKDALDRINRETSD